MNELLFINVPNYSTTPKRTLVDVFKFIKKFMFVGQSTISFTPFEKRPHNFHYLITVI